MDDDVRVDNPRRVLYTPNMARLSLFLILALPAAASAGSVERIQVDIPATAGLFPGSAGGAMTFPVAGVGSPIPSLPPSAITGGSRELAPNQALAPNLFLRADPVNGLFQLSGEQPRTSQAPMPEGVPASVGAAPEGQTDDDGKLLAQKAGPLAYALWQARQENIGGPGFESKLRLAFDGQKTGNVQEASVGGREDSSAPRLLRDGDRPDVDRNSVTPFSRALVRYGIAPDQVQAIVRAYLNAHPGAHRTYNGRLLGIRAANLMAQYLAANEPHHQYNSPGHSWSMTLHKEETTSDPREKQAMILAALFHRTADPRLQEVPTGLQAGRYLRDQYSEASALLARIKIHQDNMSLWVSALIEATDYSRFSDYHKRQEAQSALNRALNLGTDGPDTRAASARLGAVLQLVTRSAMFVDGPKLAEDAVRARAEEARAEARRRGQEGPSDSEAFLAAAAEIDQILSGHMPMSPKSYLTLPDGAARDNLRHTYLRFRSQAADLINSRKVDARIASAP